MGCSPELPKHSLLYIAVARDAPEEMWAAGLSRDNRRCGNDCGRQPIALRRSKQVAVPAKSSAFPVALAPRVMSLQHPSDQQENSSFSFPAYAPRPDQPADVVEHDLRIRERTRKVRDLAKS